MNHPFTTAAAPEVTLVIPARNAARVLRQCLEAAIGLLARDGLREIIVVDDGSTDETPEIARSLGVRVIPGTGAGPGAARNLGWRAAQTPLVWFIDSDCVAEPDALKLLLPHMADCSIAGVGGSYGNMRPDALLACLIHEEIIQRHLAMPAEVNFLATFNVLYRRDVLQQTGGFDESLKLAQDAELSFRIRAAGHRLKFEGRSRVRHFHPTRLIRYLRTQFWQGYFRVMLYARHPNRMAGDSYSGLIDHIQPPLAMVTLLATLMLSFLPGSLAPLFLAMMLLILQFPLAFRLLRRTGKMSCLAFVPLGFVRAFSRGAGMSLAVVDAASRPFSFASSRPAAASNHRS
jgi:glycosyltransferase involved in cell wall biosynthesis